MRVLLIEDEKSLASILSELLEKSGYVVDSVYNGQDGFDYAVMYEYDIIILDVMLPKMNGYEVARKLRDKNCSIPILMLTAMSHTDDTVMGLDSGADDYLTKPFETKELLARIRSLLRRKAIYVGSKMTYGDLEIDKDKLMISNQDKEIKVSNREFQILEFLINNKERILSKEKIIERVWGYDFDGEYNQVEVYVSFIRKKLKHIHSNVIIKAHRGIGYSLEVKND